MQEVQITELELRELLNDETRVEETLAKYFEVDESQPFKGALRLRPEVEVISEDDMPQFAMIGSTILWLANNWARRKRLKRYKKMLEEHPGRLRLVSEGDSWFQHPRIEDTIDHLSNHYAIYSLGAAGDELRNMFKENEYLPALEDQEARGILFSGGGNDIMGGRFGSFLNSYTPGNDPKRFLNDTFFAELDQMMNIYRAIYTSLGQLLPDVKIFTHGYDYVIPRNGKWLGKPMVEKGIDTPQDKIALSRVIIDEFGERMIALAAKFPNVEYVDTRRTVCKWHDELHPDKNGFQQVALKFYKRINETLGAK